jgi:ketosteroid isomerase-like protein
METIDGAMADLYRAMLADDAEGLDRLLAGEVVYVHSAGAIENKQEFLDAVRNRFWEYKQMIPESQRVITLGDMAMVHAVLDFEGGKRGEAHKPIRMFTTLVWMRQRGAWRLISRQATKLP